MNATGVTNMIQWLPMTNPAAIPIRKAAAIDTNAWDVVIGPRGVNQARNNPITTPTNVVMARHNLQSDQMVSNTLLTKNLLEIYFGGWILDLLIIDSA